MFTTEASAPAQAPGRFAPRERREDVSSSPLFDPVLLARSVWSRRFLILVFTLLGLAGAVAVAVTTPRSYKATTQILVDPRDIKVVANEVTPNGLPSEATLALIESQTAVILSNNVLSRVVAKADLESDPEFNGTLKTGIASLLPAVFTTIGSRPDDELRARELRVLERLRHALTVERETKSFVINLTVESFDARKAAELANITAEVFIAEQGRVQSETARRATGALSSRLSELRQSVVEAEGRVEEYKSQNALIGVGGRLVDDDYIVRINDQLAKARGDITALRVRADSMRRASVEDVVRGTLPEELSSAALVRLRQTYSELAQQAAIIGTKLGPRHPQRIASEGALGAARQAIAGELGRIVAAAQTELARATETERNLTTQIADLKAKQVETSGSFVKLRELEREVDASRAVYEAFLLRARETSEQESLNTANVRVISDATTPLDPAGLSRKILVVAGVVLGFVAGVSLALALAILAILTGKTQAETRAEDAMRLEGIQALAPSRSEAMALASEDAPSVPETAASPDPIEVSDREDKLHAAVEGETGLLLREPSEVFAEAADEAQGAYAPAREEHTLGDIEARRAIARDERAKLRERVRALSEPRPGVETAAPPKADVAELTHDIASIRATVAEIRRRKATIGRLA